MGKHYDMYRSELRRYTRGTWTIHRMSYKIIPIGDFVCMCQGVKSNI